jgi:hypothetical protein
MGQINYRKIGKYIVNPESRQFSIIVTRRCFRKCRYCVEKADYAQGPVYIDGLAMLAAVDRVLEWNPEYRDVVVTGGEPLMCHNLPEFLEGLKRRELNVFLNTSTVTYPGGYSVNPDDSHNILSLLDKLAWSPHDTDDETIDIIKRVNYTVPVRASVLTFDTAQYITDRLIDWQVCDSILLRNPTVNSADEQSTKFFIPRWLDSPLSSENYNNFETYYNFSYRGSLVRLKHAQNDRMRQQMMQVKNLVIEPIIQPDGSIGRWWDDNSFNI